MGTNYYARYSPCPTCHRCSSEKHIGKSSAGWRFLFESHEGISSWSDWKEEFKQIGVEIWNEYNEPITVQELVDIVDLKQKDQYNQPHTNDRYHRQDSDGYDFGQGVFS